MRVTLAALLRDAWRSWRHDKELLIAIAGLFHFLPAFGVALLIPDMPELAAGADPTVPATLAAYQTVLVDWLMHYGLWIALAEIAALYGQFAMVGLYVSGQRPAVGSALAAALRRLPLLMLAMFAIAIPVTAVLLVFLAVPILMPGHVIVITIVAARALLVMPIVLAESPIGPLAAVGRSFRMTHGHTLMLAAAVLTVLLAVMIGTWPFVAIDQWMADAPNPIARAIVDSFEALVAAAGAITMALLQVAAYRRLSST